jgi:hypothetical protein
MPASRLRTSAAPVCRVAANRSRSRVELLDRPAQSPGAYCVGVTEIPAAVAEELARLRAENARLMRMLKLSPRQAEPPDPAQAGFFEAPPGPVHHDSPPDAKVAFFRALFAARTDIYATRYENLRTGKKGWLPVVRGGWQTGVPHEKRDYLPLTANVLAAHLKGEVLSHLIASGRHNRPAAAQDRLRLPFLLLRRRRTGQALRSGSAGSRQRRNNEPERGKA